MYDVVLVYSVDTFVPSPITQADRSPCWCQHPVLVTLFKTKFDSVLLSFKISLSLC